MFGVSTTARYGRALVGLIDTEGSVVARFMPAEGRAGVAVTDRYGELYYSGAAETTELPPVGEIREWIEAIDRQCAI